MKQRRISIPQMFVAVVLPLAIATVSVSAAAEPGIVVAGGSTDGTVLLGELNCTACHAAGAVEDRLLSKQSPILTDVAARVTPQYLRAFLTEPHAIKPGTTMPDVLHGLEGRQRDETVDLLVHYLSSLGTPIDQQASGSSLTQIVRGKALYHTIGCVACHAADEPPPTHESVASIADDEDEESKETDEEDKAQRRAQDLGPRRSVPFGDLASKTTVEALARFLNDPLSVRPSGRMPHLNLQPGEANLLAAYLLRDQYTDTKTAPGAGLDVAYYKGGPAKMPDFSKLTPELETSAKDFDVKSIRLKDGKTPASNFTVRFEGLIEVAEAGEYRFWTRSDDGSVLWIDGKEVVNNDGPHGPQEKEGRIQLSKGRHGIELGFTQGGGGYELSVSWQPPSAKQRSAIPPGVLLHASAAMIPKGISDFKLDAAKAERGRAVFNKMGCAGCHVTDGATKPVAAKALAQLTDSRGCLADQPATGQPNFDLSDAQREALGAAITLLQSSPPALTATQQVDQLMTAFSCYACHDRNGKGGPDEKRAQYFTYEHLVDLGDEGRLPPPLNETGAKLTAEGFHDTLIAGRRYRTSMATRMPRFGERNIGHLPALWARADAGKIAARQITKSTRKVVADGRILVGKTHLSCINCHTWGKQHLPGAEGLDLLQTQRRVRADWFHAFMTDPQTLKPRTRMPSSWPEGKSFFADIQDGDMHRQIDAVWAFLGAGQRGGMPRGLTGEDNSLLVVSDEPILFRAFVDQIGAHTILIGFPQQTNVAFDANRVRMVLAWNGDFVSTKPSWDGRAGQYTKIDRSDVADFADGPPLVRLSSLNDPWPKDVAKQKLGSNRAPAGYRFRGYRYDERRVPTLIYDVGDIRVEETPEVGYENDLTHVQRTLRLSSAADVADLHLLVATGAKIVEQDGTFVVDERFTQRVRGGRKPFIRERGQQELIVPVPLRASAVTEIEMRLAW